MSDRLVGYKIYDSYYMKSDIRIESNSRENGREISKVFKIDKEESLLGNIPMSDIMNIYEDDHLSVEIYKLRVKRLEESIEELEQYSEWLCGGLFDFGEYAKEEREDLLSYITSVSDRLSDAVGSNSRGGMFWSLQVAFNIAILVLLVILNI